MARPSAPFNYLNVDDLLSKTNGFLMFLAVMVGLSYVLSTLGFIVIIWRGYKTKSYGMPGLSVAAALSLCFFTGWVGSWAEPCLFFGKESWYLLWIWRLWAVLNLILYVQYIRYGQKDVIEPLTSYFYMYAVLLVVVAALTQWSFILFFQDYYVNIACPLLCILPMAAGYFATPFLRKDLNGLSIPGAWLTLLGTALLYLAVVLNNMAEPYPGHQQTGYGFIYWIYGITVALLYGYTVILIKKRSVLRAAEAEKAGEMAAAVEAA